MAIKRPINIDITIEIIEIYIVVVKPLKRNLRFVKPSTFCGDNINQFNSLLPHEVKGRTKSKKAKFLTLYVIKNKKLNTNLL